MTKEKILAYLAETPYNTNPAIVRQMLDELLNTSLVASKEDLVAAFEKGGKVALADNVTVDADIVITSNTEFDMNGKELIAADNHSGWYMLKADNAELVISGKGLISAGNSEKAIPVTATNGAKVIINDGEFACKGDLQCVYANGGKVEIHGGIYRVVEGEATKDLLNVQNTKEVTDIQVYGGTFIGRNPALGDDALGGSFVAEGKKVVEIEPGVFKVM